MFSSSPLPNGSFFPSEMVRRFPAHYVSLEEFAIGYGSAWSFCWAVAAVAAAPAVLGWWERGGGGGGGIHPLWGSPARGRRCEIVPGINNNKKKKQQEVGEKRGQSIVIKPPSAEDGQKPNGKVRSAAKLHDF